MTFILCAAGASALRAGRIMTPSRCTHLPPSLSGAQGCSHRVEASGGRDVESRNDVVILLKKRVPAARWPSLGRVEKPTKRPLLTARHRHSAPRSIRGLCWAGSWRLSCDDHLSVHSSERRVSVVLLS